MIIENQRVVTLNYRLTIAEEGVEIEVEKTSPEKPFVFLFGASQLLPEFERNLSGKSAGDKFDFTIDAGNGYGLHDANNVVPVPVSAFAGENGQYDPVILKIGAVLQMMDQDGNRYEGEIKEVNGDQVMMDFNHPLSDKQLHFIGNVVSVRQATLEELQHGHVHGPGGHHHH